MEALRELGPEDPPFASPLPFAKGVAVLGEARLVVSFFFLIEGPGTGLIRGEGRTLLARASAVVLRFLRILEEPFAIKASGEAVGVKLLLTALIAGEPCMAACCDCWWCCSWAGGSIISPRLGGCGPSVGEVRGEKSSDMTMPVLPVEKTLAGVTTGDSSGV